MKLATTAHRTATSAPASMASNTTKVVVFVLDDVGKDQIRAYGAGGQHTVDGELRGIPYAHTPNLDAVFANGRVFHGFHATPLCSPSRVAMVTGRLPDRTGVGRVMDTPADLIDLSGELFLPTVLRAARPEVRCPLFGKAHLGVHPLLAGFDRFVGTDHNLTNHNSFDYVVDNEVLHSSTYSSELWADAAVDWLAMQEPTQSFLLTVNMHAPHTPYDEPPFGTYDPTKWAPTTGPASDGLKAGLEALDYYIGLVLVELDLASTLVLIVADNGTEGDAIGEGGGATQEYDPRTDTYYDPLRCKRSTFGPGVNVPMVAIGKGVVPGESHGLVHAVDIFPTVAELFGVPAPTDRVIDGVSFAAMLAGGPSARTTLSTGVFAPNGPNPGTTSGRRMVRDERFKLHCIDAPWGTPEAMRLYDVVTDPTESENLLVDGLPGHVEDAFNALMAVQGAIHASIER